jgi:prepilin-type N-terminal cleavage/methylation domain-containing protein
MKRGVTLIELLVALAVLAVALSVTGLAVRSLEPSAEWDLLRSIESARARAIASGRPVVLDVDGRAIRFAPDGSALGGPLLTDSLVVGVDALTGEVRLETR